MEDGAAVGGEFGAGGEGGGDRVGGSGGVGGFGGCYCGCGRGFGLRVGHGWLGGGWRSLDGRVMDFDRV